MHPMFAQKRAVYEAMQARATAATSNFYAMTNRIEPIRLPRFNVIPSGRGMFGIVERETGTVRQVCAGHNEACREAQKLESAPEHEPVPGFAKLMLRWTIAFTTILLLFAAYGALPCSATNCL